MATFSLLLLENRKSILASPGYLETISTIFKLFSKWM